MKKIILESMLDDITGQLIITTHNTYMLEFVEYCVEQIPSAKLWEEGGL